MESSAFMNLPRVAGRLTAELIGRSPQGLNACDEYELELRGHKIAAIENLGATQNQFDAIDLSDNEVVKLEGFPRLPRLHTLTLCNNRIARVGKGLGEQLPNLSCLVLTNNRVAGLADLDALAPCAKLAHLSLLGNPVTRQPDYRLYAAHALPNLKVLDFKKIKREEREAALAKFGGEGGARAASEARARGSSTDAGAEAVGMETDGEEKAEKKGPTPEQLLPLRAAIANAAPLEEVTRLEEALTSGVVPSDLKLGPE